MPFLLWLTPLFQVTAAGCAGQRKTVKSTNMGRKKWTEDYFSKRIRTERERREWSQADMAKMLSDKGIPMHWTTVAKIEKGDRSVRIDEAAGIADLFEVSLDVLLDRSRDEKT